MTSSRWLKIGRVAGVACSFATLFAGAAFAQDQGQASGSSRQASTHADARRAWMALDRCAAYGPDFTAVEGTQSCVKISGHVHVEIGSRTITSDNRGWVQGGTAPAAMRSEETVGGDLGNLPAARHLRLQQDADPSYGGWYVR